MSAGAENPPAPEEEGLLQIFADRLETDDVSLVAASPTQRRNLERKSTFVLAGDCEDDLATTARGRALLEYLRGTALGQLTQLLLLIVCLGVYTFTPEVISWSKMVDVGLTRVDELQDGDLPPVLVKAQVDRSAMLTTENWPRPTTGLTSSVSWSGTMVLPKDGIYEFSFERVNQLEWPASFVVEPKVIQVGAAAGSLAECAAEKGGRLKVDLQTARDPDTTALQLPPTDAAEPDATVARGQAVKFTAALRNLPALGHALPPGSEVAWLVVRTPGGESMRVPRTWMHIDQDVQDIKPYKGKPYLDCSPVVVTKFLVVLLGVLIAFGQGGAPQVRECFAWANVKQYMVIAMCYCVADVAEILANSGLDPTVYIIFSQSRLLLTAVTMRVVMNTQQNTLQWVDLTVLTLLICVFQFTPDTYLKPAVAKGVEGSMVLGLICTFIKIGMSVGAGVYLQKTMQNSLSTPFAVQIVSMNITGLLFSLVVVLPMSCWLTQAALGETTLDTLVKRGPFAGPDGAWDSRTLGVVAIYQVREWSTNLVVKRFDALVKNLCNAGATLASYFFGIWFMGKVGFVVDGQVNIACVTKLCTIFGVMLLVYNYSLGKLYVKQQAKG